MIKKLNAIIISALILIVTISFFVDPDDSFSVNENRALTDFPEFSFESVFDGEYMENLSTYLTDQFPMRKGAVKLKNHILIDVLNSKYVNNIFIGKEGYFIEDYKRPQNTDKIIANLNKFQDSINIKTDVMLVPTQVTIYEDKLPDYASPLSQLKEIDKYYSMLNMNTIDLYDVLMSNRSNKISDDGTYEQLFYKLDHHWTSDGAYYAYAAYCAQKGFEPVSRSEYTVKEVDNFKGTIYSKLNYDNEYTQNGETIKVYEKPMNISVKYDGKESTSLYNMEYADKKDKYSLFLNNINSFVEITNNDIKSDRSIVIIKDSYANSMIPFLVNHYKNIYVFDTRSYGESVSQFINENKVDDVLLLYNMNTIDTDTGINAIY